MSQKDGVINAINREISLCDVIDKNEKINTIYFGGGTPSLISSEELMSILASIHKKFVIAEDAEITLEANPDNINNKSLMHWKGMGVNRLSVGIQSFVDRELKWMNRAHTAAESHNCIDEILQAGFTNFSVDLIYGSPLQSNDDFKKNVDIIFNKNVPHISCYALTVEPKTALDAMIRKNPLIKINSDNQSVAFLSLMQWMRSAGYEHYEISNFAKPGMRSGHNSAYWKGIPYYGFGPSAHSFDGDTIRRWNVANNSTYIQSLSKGLVPYTEEVLTKTQQVNEYIMISLRTMEGIDLDKVETLFGEMIKNEILLQSKKYIEFGNLKLNNNMLALTDNGKLLADGIAAALFFSDVAS